MPRPLLAARAAIAAAALLALPLAACSRARGGGAGEPPRYAYLVLDVRDAALAARDLETAARAYAVNAQVIDAATAAVVLRGRDEIRAAHARFLDACPRARVEVLDRSYEEGGRFVTDVQRVRCDRAPPVQGWVRYEIEEGTIVRVLKHASPPFGG